MHHLNYLIILILFPILFTGLLVLPATLFNKKGLFFLVPFAEIVLHLSFIAKLLSKQFENPFLMFKYFFSGIRLIHIPTVIVPLLIISIIVANYGANFVQKMYTEFNNNKKHELYGLYTKLDKISSQEKALLNVECPAFNIINEETITNTNLFESLDTKINGLKIINNHDMINPLDENEEDSIEEELIEENQETEISNEEQNKQEADNKESKAPEAQTA